MFMSLSALRPTEVSVNWHFNVEAALFVNTEPGFLDEV